jgi:penicillin G amidase
MPRQKLAFLLVALAALWITAWTSAQEAQPETAPWLRKESQSRLAQLEGRIAVPGLEKAVEVRRDRWGVAHIYAETKHDLFFAQGFAAAQDRLYQMEIWRRTGTGELAEVFGPDFVERDRIARLARYRGDMEAEWKSYSPDAKQIAEAFTAGVNAFVEHCGDRLPIEFTLLGFRPGRWEPQHVVLRIAGLLMTRNITQEIARAEMVAKLGVDETMKWMPPDPARQLRPDPGVNLDGLDGRVLAGYRSAISIPTLEGEEGSNNWVVAGSLSSTGKPLLASDPHRPVVLPSLRYMVHLVGPGWNVIGSGEPALPGVAIGHNERVGWGFTIVPYDVADLVVETLDPEQPNRYRFRDHWMDMKVEHETIRVKGREPVEAELKFTRNGPVIWEDPSAKRAVAIRWTGTEPGTAGYLGSLAIDRAKDWKGFLEAMKAWRIPAENMVYADVDGNIGWIAAGMMPIREGSLGLLPVPGESGKYDWKGFRAVGDLPQRYNPKERYIATANHNILPPGYRHDLAFDWAAPYRFQRIDEVLRGGGKFTIEDFERLQYDETSLPARQLIALLEKLPEWGPIETEQALKMLEGWDKVVGRNSAAAALFEVWLKILTPRLVDAQAPAEARELVSRNLDMTMVIRMLSEAPEDVRKEVMLESLADAFRQAQALLGTEPSTWRWGTLHTITFRHPLANTPARASVFNRGPIARGGDSLTPNATSGPNYHQSSGASYRHILDFADWDRSVFTSTPGQSGQPGSPHYDDLLPLWAEGKYAPLPYSRGAVEKYTAHTLVLAPE